MAGGQDVQGRCRQRQRQRGLLLGVLLFLGALVAPGTASASNSPLHGCRYSTPNVGMYIDGSSPFGGTDPWFQSGSAWLNGSDANPTPGTFTPRMRLWYWNDGNSGVYGYATPCNSAHVWGFTETDARMNRWYADNQPSIYYVNFYRTVASHELGHLLGLGHNNSVTACSSIAILYSDPNKPYSCGQYNPRPADVTPINSIY